jgi:hypothetical protein
MTGWLQKLESRRRQYEWLFVTDQVAGPQECQETGMEFYGRKDISRD